MNTLSWPPLLRATQRTPTALLEIGQNLLPFNSSVLQSLMSLCVLAFRIFQLCKMGISRHDENPENNRILFCSHIHESIYRKEWGKRSLEAFSYSGGNLFSQVSVGPVLLCYVYQFCPLDLHTARRCIGPCNVPKPEFWHNCKKLWYCFMWLKSQW